MPPPKKKMKKSNEESNNTFIWTDEKRQLLLEVILHYKSDKAGQGFDWESVKSKYCDIRDFLLRDTQKIVKINSSIMKICQNSPKKE